MDQQWWFPYLVGLPAAAVVVILIYGWSDWDELAVATLTAGGAFLAGGLIGFIFGIPRSLAGTGAPEAGTRGGYRANTNLEEISDWLTKILVGVGLIQATTIARHLGDLVQYLGSALGGDALDEAFAAALLVIYSISGALIFYLTTRIWLAPALAHADRDAVIALVHETRREQDEKDVAALSLVRRQLDPGTIDRPSQDALHAAVAATSELARNDIFNMSREQRAEAALSGDAEAASRTVPIFRALARWDSGRQAHRNYAQLGFALRNANDLEGADDALTEAIRLRDAAGIAGLPHYEKVRALTRIARYGANPSAEIRRAIEADLEKASRTPRLADEILKDKAVQRFRAPAPPPA